MAGKIAMPFFFHKPWSIGRGDNQRPGGSGSVSFFPCFSKVPGSRNWSTMLVTQPMRNTEDLKLLFWHGSLNVPIEHHPAIRYMVYNGYYKVMSNIPKMGQLPTPVYSQLIGMKTAKTWFTRKNHGGFRPPRGQAEQFGDQPDPPNCLGKPQKTWWMDVDSPKYGNNMQ